MFKTNGAKDSVETPVVWGDLNPIFNKKLVMLYKVAGVAEVQPMTVTIFDQDKLSGRDVIGTVTVDILDCISKPGEWGINKIYDIGGIDKKFKVKGEVPQVYFQMKFLRDTDRDEGDLPPILEDITQIVSDRKRVGTVVIRIIHARGLIRADSGITGNASDPYVEFTIPRSKESKYKTKVIKNTIIPMWKEEFKIPIEINDIRYVDNAQFKVYDYSSFIAGGDTVIGFCDLDIKPALNDHNAWTINKVLELDGPEKLKQKLKLKN